MAADEQTTTVGLAGALQLMLEKIDTVSKEVKSINNRLQTVERNLDHLNKTFVHTVGVPYSRNLFQEIASVHDSVLFTDFYASQFQKNMAIRGFEETPGENVDAIVRKFMNERLEISPSKIQAMGFYTQRMPRVYTSDVHPPIFVKFARHDDHTYVKGKAEKREKKLQADNITLDFY